MKNEGAESDSEGKFGERLGKVYGYGKAEKSGLVIIYCTVGEMKKALQMMSKGWKGCSVVGNWIKLEAMQHHLPS